MDSVNSKTLELKNWQILFPCDRNSITVHSLEPVALRLNKSLSLHAQGLAVLYSSGTPDLGKVCPFFVA